MNFGLISEQHEYNPELQQRAVSYEENACHRVAAHEDAEADTECIHGVDSAFDAACERCILHVDPYEVAAVSAAAAASAAKFTAHVRPQGDVRALKSCELSLEPFCFDL